MGSYVIEVTPSARRDLGRLPTAVVDRVVFRIGTLAEDPRPSGCRKLHNQANLWRIRVGDYRVIYAIYDNEERVDIIHVRRRDKAY